MEDRGEDGEMAWLSTSAQFGLGRHMIENLAVLWRVIHSTIDHSDQKGLTTPTFAALHAHTDRIWTDTRIYQYTTNPVVWLRKYHLMFVNVFVSLFLFLFLFVLFIIFYRYLSVSCQAYVLLVLQLLNKIRLCSGNRKLLK